MQVKRRKCWRMRHSPFSNPSLASSTSQLILQPFRCFVYVIGTSPTSQLILQPSAASPTSQGILQPFRCFTYAQLILEPFRRFTYVTAHSPTLPLLHLRNRHFTYFTWRAAHAQRYEKTVCGGLACYSKLLSLEVATVLDGQLRMLLRAVNLFSFSHTGIVYSVQ